MKNLKRVFAVLLLTTISLTSFSQNSNPVKQLRKAIIDSKSEDVESMEGGASLYMRYDVVSFSDVFGTTIVAEYKGEKYLIKYSYTVTEQEEEELPNGDIVIYTFTFHYNSKKELVFMIMNDDGGGRLNTVSSGDERLTFHSEFDETFGYE